MTEGGGELATLNSSPRTPTEILEHLIHLYGLLLALRAHPDFAGDEEVHRQEPFFQDDPTKLGEFPARAPSSLQDTVITGGWRRKDDL
ncbi:hypothetical protein Y1Q_0009620 [Alligator mississippiensis]|uniref:Uncharacterized protein n=1 Tax=Alligator mississippiensis TaxID=8496 RepID=A0A151NVJ9_ALLMI|nr:hypothetical protein Y1Q_0009620 [Alligator mississippiensis]